MANGDETTGTSSTTTTTTTTETSTTTAAENSDNVQNLDLGSVSGYMDSVSWLTNNVLLNDEKKGVLQLEVHLPPTASETKQDHVSVFMRREDAYIIGFRGKDGTYVLADEGEDFEKDLRDSKLLGTKEKASVIPGIESGHRSLGTFVHTKEGTRGRTYSLADLRNAIGLSRFSLRDDEIPYDDVRGALSALVCMTAESARSRMISDEFQGIYRGERAQANDAMQSYDKAKRITLLSECFANDHFSHRVEKLGKRAAEIDSELEAAQKKAAGAGLPFDRKLFLDQAITKTAPPVLDDQAKRLRDISKELQLGGSDMLSLIKLCNDQPAMRAAQRGVVVPPLGATFVR